MVAIFQHDAKDHLGTPDRDQPLKFHDFPEKKAWMESAAREFVRYMNSGWSKPTAPANIFQSEFIELSILLKSFYSEKFLNQFLEASFRAQLSASSGGSPFISDFGHEAAISAGTYFTAMQSLTAALNAGRFAVHSTRNEPSAALMWPPGHHAEPLAIGLIDATLRGDPFKVTLEDRQLAGDELMAFLTSETCEGFSYFANAAITMLFIQFEHLGIFESIPRVGCLDIDNHAGNGTRKGIAGRPRMKMWDLEFRSKYDHKAKRYVDGDLVPNSRKLLNCGREYPYHYTDKRIKATAHPMIVEAQNLEILEFWSKDGRIENQHRAAATCEEILSICRQKVLPSIINFDPHYMVLSAGVDSAENDPLGGMGLTPGGFYTLVRGLRAALPHTKFVLLTEGGYTEGNWHYCFQPILRALSDDPLSEIATSSMWNKRERKLWLGAAKPT